MDKETAIETALIIAFFTAMLYLGPGTASEHRITHEFPTGYSASDSYQHQVRTEAIRQAGQYKYEAPYMVVGLTDVTGFYPPLLYHVSVLLADVSGLPSYDALFIIVWLAISAGAMMAYYLARNLSRPVALLALPLMLLAATGKPFLGMVTFGQMPFALASLFLVAAGWATTKLGLRQSYALIAIFLSGTIMSHTSETIFFLIIISIVIGASLAANTVRHKLGGLRKTLSENRNMILGIILAAASTSYFLLIFIGTWLKSQPYRFGVETVSASFPAATVFLKDFGFMLAAIVAGLAAAAIFAAQRRKELGSIISSPKLFTLLFSAYMILVGLGTYIGFGVRSFQARFSWPITLAPLAGFGTYQAVRVVLRATSRKANVVVVAAIITVILSAAVLSAYYKPNFSQGMTKEHWEAMRWIAGNTPKDASIYVLYSQLYSQTSVLYNTERVNYFFDIKEFVDAINNISRTGKFGRMTKVMFPSDSGIGLPYRKGLLSFGLHGEDTAMSGTIDICSSDYYLVDLAMQEQFAQANNYLLQGFLKANMTVEYRGNYVAVLKNNNVGGDCVA
ncbi:hypothetical protein HYY73_06260 [Candidatus Woesearchaeota archaeon]|nr:hypothetical protein [Candidatus Woesearchaeota archaeon]